MKFKFAVDHSCMIFKVLSCLKSFTLFECKYAYFLLLFNEILRNMWFGEY